MVPLENGGFPLSENDHRRHSMLENFKTSF